MIALAAGAQSVMAWTADGGEPMAVETAEAMATLPKSSAAGMDNDGVLGDEALVVEGEDGVERAVAAALDAAFARLGDDVNVVPLQLGCDTPDRGAVELPLPREDG